MHRQPDGYLCGALRLPRPIRSLSRNAVNICLLPSLTAASDRCCARVDSIGRSGLALLQRQPLGTAHRRSIHCRAALGPPTAVDSTDIRMHSCTHSALASWAARRLLSACFRLAPVHICNAVVRCRLLLDAALRDVLAAVRDVLVALRVVLVALRVILVAASRTQTLASTSASCCSTAMPLPVPDLWPRSR
jgi:hypothetical protein